MAAKPSLQKDLKQLLIKLLQGFVVKDETGVWNTLLMHQNTVREYFSKLGLFLHLDELDGYAFLKTSPAYEEEVGEVANESDMGTSESTLPKELKGSSLTRRIPLSFELTLLLILLREALMQFDESSRADHRLILSRAEIYDLLKTFYKDRTDETKLVRRFDSLIAKAIELQVISELKSNSEKLEVHRVIRAMVDCEKLSTIKSALLSHAQQALTE